MMSMSAPQWFSKCFRAIVQELLGIEQFRQKKIATKSRHFFLNKRNWGKFLYYLKALDEWDFLKVIF